MSTISRGDFSPQLLQFFDTLIKLLLLLLLCTHDSYQAGLFGYLRLTRTYVRMILIRQDCLVTLD